MLSIFKVGVSLAKSALDGIILMSLLNISKICIELKRHWDITRSKINWPLQWLEHKVFLPGMSLGRNVIHDKLAQAMARIT